MSLFKAALEIIIAEDLERSPHPPVALLSRYARDPGFECRDPDLYDETQAHLCLCGECLDITLRIKEMTTEEKISSFNHDVGRLMVAAQMEDEEGRSAAGKIRRDLESAIGQALGVEWPDFVELNRSRLSYRVCRYDPFRQGKPVRKPWEKEPWQSVRQLMERSESK